MPSARDRRSVEFVRHEMRDSGGAAAALVLVLPAASELVFGLDGNEVDGVLEAGGGIGVVETLGLLDMVAGPAAMLGRVSKPHACSSTVGGLLVASIEPLEDERGGKFNPSLLVVDASGPVSRSVEGTALADVTAGSGFWI